MTLNEATIKWPVSPTLSPWCGLEWPSLHSTAVRDVVIRGGVTPVDRGHQDSQLQSLLCQSGNDTNSNRASSPAQIPLLVWGRSRSQAILPMENERYKGH